MSEGSGSRGGCGRRGGEGVSNDTIETKSTAEGQGVDRDRVSSPEVDVPNDGGVAAGLG